MWRRFVLVHLAAQIAPEDDPRGIVAAIVLREKELEPFKTALTDDRDGITTIAEFVIANESSALLTVATSHHWPVADVLNQCLRGFYLRLRLLASIGMGQKSDAPSVFVRLRGEVAAVDKALTAAASEFREDRFLYVSSESSPPVLAAERLLDVVAASYRGGTLPAEYVDAFRANGRPTGWIHYTLDPACRCLGCFDAMSAVSSQLSG